MPWIGDAGKQDVDLAHGEHALQTTSYDVLDGQCLIWRHCFMPRGCLSLILANKIIPTYTNLCLVHRKGVARDQWQLHQYRLALARRQSLLPRSPVDVVEI